ncbi:hypothetical protein HK096_007211, partial [Nowakowskiella sp. JEL0078]
MLTDDSEDMTKLTVSHSPKRRNREMVSLANNDFSGLLNQDLPEDFDEWISNEYLFLFCPIFIFLTILFFLSLISFVSRNQKLTGFDTSGSANVDTAFKTSRFNDDDENTLADLDNSSDTLITKEAFVAKHLSTQSSSNSLSSTSTEGNESDEDAEKNILTERKNRISETKAISPFTLSFATFPPPPKTAAETTKVNQTDLSEASKHERQGLFAQNRYSEDDDVDGELEANLVCNSPTILPQMPDTPIPTLKAHTKNRRDRLEDFDLDDDDRDFAEVLEMGTGNWIRRWMRGFGSLITCS